MKMDDIEDLLKSYKRVDDAAISFNLTEINAIRNQLLKWYQLNRRKLPWRGDDITGYPPVPPPSAYGTWISEIMLQQTRVETVIPYWFKWMGKYPTVESLSLATPEEVNALWAGLGYYRRVQQILLGAKNIVNERNMIFPSTVIELLQIPGIGPYTAGAISSIAFHQQQAAVDGNVIRVLSRLRAIDEEMGGKLEKLCWTLAESLVDPSNPGDFNQAMMELGATVCKPTSPLCDQCPVNMQCHARKLVDYNKMANIDTIKKYISPDSAGDSRQLPIDVTEFPHKKQKNKAREMIFAVCVFSSTFIKVQSYNNYNDNNNSDISEFDQDPKEIRYLMVRRPATGLLANQWEFPNKLIWEEEKTTTKLTKTKSVSKTKTKLVKESSPITEIIDVISLEDDTEDITSTSTLPQFNTEQIQHHVIEMLDQEYSIQIIMRDESQDINTQHDDNNLQITSDHFNTSNRNSIAYNSLNNNNNKHKIIIMKDNTMKSSNGGSSNVSTSKQTLLSSSSSLLLSNPSINYLEPLIHIFSHQKHIMYLYSKHVYFTAGVIGVATASTTSTTGNSYPLTNSTTLKMDHSPSISTTTTIDTIVDATTTTSDLENVDRLTSGSTQNVTTNSLQCPTPLSWYTTTTTTTSATSKTRREIRWMTLEELQSAGVTSGVQKILSTVTLVPPPPSPLETSSSTPTITSSGSRSKSNKRNARSDTNNSDKRNIRKEVSLDVSRDQKKFKQTTLKF